MKLPNGWWVFGLDQALHGDIDVYQFKFFAELCQQKVISFSDLHGISSCVKFIFKFDGLIVAHYSISLISTEDLVIVSRKR